MYSRETVGQERCIAAVRHVEDATGHEIGTMISER
jgi:hypothetical protein